LIIIGLPLGWIISGIAMGRYRMGLTSTLQRLSQEPFPFSTVLHRLPKYFPDTARPNGRPIAMLPCSLLPDRPSLVIGNYSVV
jgi:hypothetical protein